MFYAQHKAGCSHTDEVGDEALSSHWKGLGTTCEVWVLPPMGGGEDRCLQGSRRNLPYCTMSTGMEHWSHAARWAENLVPRGQLSIVVVHPQSAKERHPMTRASLATYSNVTFELLIIFPFWQPNKCYERVILSIHCTLRVNKCVRRAPERELAASASPLVCGELH